MKTKKLPPQVCCEEIPPILENMKCGEVLITNVLKKVFFNPTTKEVKDEFGNLIGTGVLVNDELTIHAG